MPVLEKFVSENYNHFEVLEERWEKRNESLIKQDDISIKSKFGFQKKLFILIASEVSEFDVTGWEDDYSRIDQEEDEFNVENSDQRGYEEAEEIQSIEQSFHSLSFGKEKE